MLEHLDSVMIDEHVKWIYRCTCQILKFSTSKTVALGSGVLVEVDGRYFIWSAAHVIEAADLETLAISVGEESILSPGGDWYVNDPKTNRNADKMDVAIVELIPSSVELLSQHYDFVQMSHIQVNHNLKEELNYLTLGYPSSQSKTDYKTKIFESNPFIYQTMPTALADNSKLELVEEFNVVMNYDKKRVLDAHSGTSSVGPDLYGLSGSGLWFFPDIGVTSHQSTEQPKLIAIMHEWSKTKKYMIGTRIDVYTGILNSALGITTPQGKYSNYNFTIF